MQAKIVKYFTPYFENPPALQRYYAEGGYYFFMSTNLHSMMPFANDPCERACL